MSAKRKGTRRGAANKRDVAQTLGQLMMKRMWRDAWVLEALADMAYGTVGGEPPPVDVNALLDSGLTATQIMKKIRAAYEDREM